MPCPLHPNKTHPVSISGGSLLFTRPSMHHSIHWIQTKTRQKIQSKKNVVQISLIIRHAPRVKQHNKAPETSLADRHATGFLGHEEKLSNI